MCPHGVEELNAVSSLNDHGGLTVSLDGGFEEIDESVCAVAT